MDHIEITPSHTACVGRKAVEVFRLASLISALKLEMNCPGMQTIRGRSALSVAKKVTGLRTNKRAIHIERIELMLEQAKSEVVYVNETEGM